MNNENTSVQPLRILHIEDSALDAEIIRENLIDAGLEMQLDRAANEPEFLSFLQNGEYDLILSDYKIPGFEAPEVLRLSRTLYPDIPFICVSGAVGEEKAVELLKLGATDYIPKNRLSNLPRAMQRALDEVRERKARIKAEEERSSMEKQLQQAQKLESLGVLAGGIAHDFNNILMAIMGNADLALMRINKESPAVENLNKIVQSAARAADLAKQMLAYSGKGKYVVELIDMSLLVEEMHNMIEVSISKKAVFRLNLTTPLPSVEADATQLRQIVMNLVINSSEAIGEKSGVIAITTGCMQCDKNYLKNVWLNENLHDGLYVSLEVSDTGCGMDSDTLAKLFDPFFTTKFTGRGLGMAAVLGIVRSHKGAIRVYSEPGKGSTFKILLPAVDRPAELFNAHDHQDDWKAKGTVLLVDDEETLRAIGSEMLRELGFEVVTAEDGRDALEIFKARNDIDLVILDLSMPHLDGEQCFRELRQLKPDLKVVMSSGFSQQEVTQRFVGKGLAGVIQKPYRLSALRDEIKRVMSIS